MNWIHTCLARDWKPDHWWTTCSPMTIIPWIAMARSASENLLCSATSTTRHGIHASQNCSNLHRSPKNCRFKILLNIVIHWKVNVLWALGDISSQSLFPTHSTNCLNAVLMSNVIFNYIHSYHHVTLNERCRTFSYNEQAHSISPFVPLKEITLYYIT